MAAGQMPLKILVPAGIGGAGLFLYVRHQQAGDLRLLDWFIAGSIGMMSVLIVLASRSTTEGWEDSEDSPAVNGRYKWLIGVALLPVLLWIVYGVSDDKLKKQAQREQAAQALEEGPRMIRSGAGEPDGTGWVPVVSTIGGFSVYMPDRFNEAISALEMGGKPTPVVVVGAQMGDLKFVALAAQWTGGKRDLKARARDAVKSLGAFKSPVITREGSFEDRFPLIEVEMNTGHARGLAWVIATDRIVYGLAVEGPELTDEMREAARRFFYSFAIVTAEPNAPMTTPAPAEGAEPNR